MGSEVIITEAVTDAVSEGGMTLTDLLYKGVLGSLAEKGTLHVGFWIAGIVLCAVLGYFLGSLNFAVVISRLKFHDDIRRHGSGNAGATNMMRVYGKAAGIATFTGDIMKAVVSVLIARLLCGEVFAYLTGMCCAIGHAFPCYYRFRGGKCVAVTAAMALVLEPFVFLCLLLIFAAVVLTTRYVSLSSIAAALFYPVILHNVISSRYGHGDLRIVFVFVICALVVFLHRGNIKRLLDGTESKIDLKKGKPKNNGAGKDPAS